MALLFPSRLYVSMTERLHPHVPKSIEIKEALGRLTPEERSPPSTPPRQNRTVARKKHANEAQAKPSR